MNTISVNVFTLANGNIDDSATREAFKSQLEALLADQSERIAQAKEARETLKSQVSDRLPTLVATVFASQNYITLPTAWVCSQVTSALNVGPGDFSLVQECLDGYIASGPFTSNRGRNGGLTYTGARV